MKRTTAIIFGALLMLMLAACSQTADPVEKDADAEGKATETAEEKGKGEEKDLTLEEVFEKAAEANNQLKSFESVMTMKQKVDAGGESMDMDSEITMEYTKDPMALHQQMKISSGEESQEIDAYLAKEGFFMYEPNQKMWVKLPEEFSDQILQLSGDQTNPAGQLEQLESFVDEFDFKQDDKNYILTLKASGDKFNKFLKENVKDTLPADLPAGDEVLDGMKFNAVEYEIFLDKESFYLTALNMLMDTETDIEGEKMKMNLDVQSTYSHFNEVKTIEIPKEALENAQEINLDDMNGQ